MPTFKENIHTGRKVALIETDDISDEAVTKEKLDPSILKNIGDEFAQDESAIGYLKTKVASNTERIETLEELGAPKFKTGEVVKDTSVVSIIADDTPDTDVLSAAFGRRILSLIASINTGGDTDDDGGDTPVGDIVFGVTGSGVYKGIPTDVSKTLVANLYYNNSTAIYPKTKISLTLSYIDFNGNSQDTVIYPQEGKYFTNDEECKNKAYIISFFNSLTYGKYVYAFKDLTSLATKSVTITILKPILLWLIPYGTEAALPSDMTTVHERFGESMTDVIFCNIAGGGYSGISTSAECDPLGELSDGVKSRICIAVPDGWVPTKVLAHGIFGVDDMEFSQLDSYGSMAKQITHPTYGKYIMYGTGYMTNFQGLAFTLSNV